jgi:hypothetical protein
MRRRGKRGKEFRPEAIVQFAPARWAVAQDNRLSNKLDTLPAPDQLAYFRDQGVVFLPPPRDGAPGSPIAALFPAPDTHPRSRKPASSRLCGLRPPVSVQPRGDQPVQPFLHGGKNLNDLGEDVASYQRVACSSPRVNSGRAP